MINYDLIHCILRYFSQKTINVNREAVSHALVFVTQLTVAATSRNITVKSIGLLSHDTRIYLPHSPTL